MMISLPNANAQYDLQVVRDASRLTAAEQAALARQFDLINDGIWDKDPSEFRNIANSLFTPADGVVLLHTASGDAVGFSVYRRITVGQLPALFLRYVNVAPAHHGNGLLGKLMTRIISAERGQFFSTKVFCCWRTRNPVLYFTGRKMSARIVPDLVLQGRDQELIEMGITAARAVYPSSELDADTFCMRLAYPPGHKLKQPQRWRDRQLNDTFYSHPALQDARSALFCFAELSLPRLNGAT
jgi:hypothetical protein